MYSITVIQYKFKHPIKIFLHSLLHASTSHEKVLNVLRMEKRRTNIGANKELAYRGACSFFTLELTPIEKGSKDNKTCHRDRIAHLTAPCPSHKKL